MKFIRTEIIEAEQLTRKNNKPFGLVVIKRLIGGFRINIPENRVLLLNISDWICKNESGEFFIRTDTEIKKYHPVLERPEWITPELIEKIRLARTDLAKLTIIMDNAETDHRVYLIESVELYNLYFK